MYNKIIKAKELINQHIINTPFNLSNSLSEITGNQIYVKYENRQFTGSFKYRGALNKLLSLTIEQRKKGIIAMSAGNHAQGLSLGCKLLKIKATIVMPNNTPFEKIRKNIDYGANVIKAIPGKHSKGEWHLHKLNFQMVYILKGWVIFKYETKIYLN